MRIAPPPPNHFPPHSPAILWHLPSPSLPSPPHCCCSLLRGAPELLLPTLSGLFREPGSARDNSSEWIPPPCPSVPCQPESRAGGREPPGCHSLAKLPGSMCTPTGAEQEQLWSLPPSPLPQPTLSAKDSADSGSSKQGRVNGRRNEVMGGEGWSCREIVT